MLLSLVGAAAIGVQTAGAQTSSIGFEGHSWTGSGSEPSASKPESKLWWNDGYWWGSMWDPDTSDFHIYRLEESTETWVDTNVALDNRAGTRADALWDGNKLYVASHGFTNTPSCCTFASRLYRYSYEPESDTYSLDSGFPATINNWKTETLVIDKDSTGKLWAVWVQDTTVYVNRTVGADQTWGTPFALPVTGATGLNADDIASVVAFGGKVGVMWSNQNEPAMRFAVHVDGDADTAWSVEVAAGGPNSADDHINLKADSSGRVYAAVKTENTVGGTPLINLLVRDPGTAAWATHVFGRVGTHLTRPIVLLDEENNLIHMLATSSEVSGSIVQKTSPLNAIEFPDGPGTAFIHDAVNPKLNNATSTKQLLSSRTGMTVLSTNGATSRYWHNSTSLATGLNPNFVGAPTSGVAPLTVQFTDSSTGGATGWLWNFGDGATSTAQHPTHVYSVGGTYTVSLTVTDGTGNATTKIRSDYISVTPLTADFTGTPTSGVAPLTVDFTDTSIGTPMLWLWDFGDGTSSTLQNPSHTYAVGGTYTVSLTVTDLAGSVSTKSRSAYVDVTPLTADFAATPTMGAVPLTVDFTDTSIGTPTSWTWDFGDGGTSTLQNPSYTYATAGTYTVTLTVADAAGSTSTKTRTDYVSALPLTADFTGSPTTGTAPLTTNFTDTSIGTPTTWSWDFGDGTSSTLQNPSHTYTTAGTHTVSLTVTDAAGNTSTKTRTSYVTVSADLSFTPAADAYTKSTSANQVNNGTTLKVRDGTTSGAHYRSYLKFSVTGLNSSVTNAKLRLYVTDAGTAGGGVYAVGSGWAENTLTWNNAPAITGSPLANIGRLTLNTWVEVTLPANAFVAGNGTYSFAIMSTNPNAGTMGYSAKEGTNPAQLVLTAG